MKQKVMTLTSLIDKVGREVSNWEGMTGVALSLFSSLFDKQVGSTPHDIHKLLKDSTTVFSPEDATKLDIVLTEQELWEATKRRKNNYKGFRSQGHDSHTPRVILPFRPQGRTTTTIGRQNILQKYEFVVLRRLQDYASSGENRMLYCSEVTWLHSS